MLSDTLTVLWLTRIFVFCCPLQAVICMNSIEEHSSATGILHLGLKVILWTLSNMDYDEKLRQGFR